MPYGTEPKIILLGFQTAKPVSFEHIENCKSVFMDYWSKNPERIHKSKGKIVVHPNKQHYRIWGTNNEMFIEFVG